MCDYVPPALYLFPECVVWTCGWGCLYSRQALSDNPPAHCSPDQTEEYIVSEINILTESLSVLILGLIIKMFFACLTSIRRSLCSSEVFSSRMVLSLSSTSFSRCLHSSLHFSSICCTSRRAFSRAACRSWLCLSPSWCCCRALCRSVCRRWFARARSSSRLWPCCCALWRPCSSSWAENKEPWRSNRSACIWLGATPGTCN